MKFKLTCLEHEKTSNSISNSINKSRANIFDVF